MEKILLLINHSGLNRNEIEFACYLAELTKSSVSGIFIDPDKVGHKKTSQIHPSTSIVDPASDESYWKTKLGENKRAFALACNNKSVRINNEHSPIEDIEDIIAESRFADVLIINSDCTLDNSSEPAPSHLAKEILMKSECPVIIAPQNFQGIEEIVLAYDGGESSVYAIKQFTHLFPELSNIRLLFLQVVPVDNSEISNRQKLEEYLKDHYSGIGFHILHGRAEDELFSYFLSKKKTFIVTGAYGRKNYFPFVQRSTAELLLKTTNLPVFIAHK